MIGAWPSFLVWSRDTVIGISSVTNKQTQFKNYQKIYFLFCFPGNIRVKPQFQLTLPLPLWHYQFPSSASPAKQATCLCCFHQGLSGLTHLTYDSAPETLILTHSAPPSGTPTSPFSASSAKQATCLCCFHNSRRPVPCRLRSTAQSSASTELAIHSALGSGADLSSCTMFEFG